MACLGIINSFCSTPPRPKIPRSTAVFAMTLSFAQPPIALVLASTYLFLCFILFSHFLGGGKIPGVRYVPMVGKVTVAMLERNLLRLHENFGEGKQCASMLLKG